MSEASKKILEDKMLRKQNNSWDSKLDESWSEKSDIDEGINNNNKADISLPVSNGPKQVK
jgi:galactokinase/mevalonate kinase-like predicted kinase